MDKPSCKVCIASPLCRNDSVRPSRIKISPASRKMKGHSPSLSYQPVVYLCVLVSLLSQASTANPILSPFPSLHFLSFWTIVPLPFHCLCVRRLQQRNCHNANQLLVFTFSCLTTLNFNLQQPKRNHFLN